MLKPTRTRTVNKGRLLPICEAGGWSFSAIEAVSRQQGAPLASSVLSRINRGVIPLSARHAEVLGEILGVPASRLLREVNSVSPLEAAS